MGNFIFGLGLILGQFIFVYAISNNYYFLMIIGRAILGISSNSLSVSQSAIVAKWFREKELAFAFGLTLSIGRIGSAVNSALTPRIYESTQKIWAPCLFGGGVCIFALLCGLLLSFMDKISDRREKQASDVSDPSNKISCSDIKRFNLLYWLLTLNCGLIYSGFYGFTITLNDFISQRFGFTNVQAGEPNTYRVHNRGLYGSRLGVNHRQKRPQIIVDTIFNGSAHYCSFAIRSATKFASLQVIISLSCHWQSLESSIQLTQQFFGHVFRSQLIQKTIGTAFGITTGFQECMLSLTPLIIGKIQDATKTKRLWIFLVRGRAIEFKRLWLYC